MEKSKENPEQKRIQSESDSGFENKSSGSESEMIKRKIAERLPVLDDAKNQNFSSPKPVLPEKRPVRLPRIDGSLDRMKNAKPNLAGLKHTFLVNMYRHDRSNVAKHACFIEKYEVRRENKLHFGAQVRVKNSCENLV